jgi:hypothetical protein
MIEPTLLARTVARLRDAPGFMSFELQLYRTLTQREPTDDFGLPRTALDPLGLCRRPRADQFAADVASIAERVQVPATALANFLRTTDAVNTLAGRSEVSSQAGAGVWAAARDHAEEHTEFEVPLDRQPLLPGWLGAAVDRFWGAEKALSSFPRDLELHILTSLPLAIVEIDNLTIAGLDLWMRQHRLPEIMAVADRPLRGCLAAYAGVGVVFIDRSDDRQQRRLTLAHDAAHFVVDYLLPREKVARSRPELLDVLDAERLPTDAERFDALLADIPIGFHTHVLERDAHGGHLSNLNADVEDRAERLALELLAPLGQVLADLQGSRPEEVQVVLRERFGLPTGVAIRYANHIRRHVPRTPRSLLDAIGLDEDEPPEVRP